MEKIDRRNIDSRVGKSLDLLRRTYHGVEKTQGGWYHLLDIPTPGPSATITALSSFLLHESKFEHQDHCLQFLSHRQISSEDPLLDGGWATNTSFGQPVTEATAMICHLMQKTGLAFATNAPDIRRAAFWLIHNQNDDGGWGAFKGQASRVWLTAMAVRALGVLDRTAPALRAAADWLIGARDSKARGWGERSGQAPTVTHTAIVLVALVESNIHRNDKVLSDAVENAYRWLNESADTSTIYDDDARLENYNITRMGPDGTNQTWQNSIWHHGLPYVLSALVRQPNSTNYSLTARAAITILESQDDDGKWPGVDGSTALSMWTVWPFLEALSDFKDAILRNCDSITALSPGTAVMRGGSDSSVPLQLIILSRLFRSTLSTLRRNWAPAVLLLTIALGSTVVATETLPAKDVALGVGVPVSLLLLQIAMTRGRSGR
ncbi:prenyltransferase/squalene oxidase repeat-containing protein [Solwaraspora sp. WMMB762]|uniref:prenyltransferase/squalene oxidase repeat-containing protein n=1 Tax=Solwaraspora sp. WMMB762 TaxID=3404120 RepID=UPI003B962C1F